MNWEAVTSIATLFTGLVIFVTVILGVHQLRQLQRATQLDGMMKILADLESPNILKSIAYVRFELPKQLEDPSKLKSFASSHIQENDPVSVILRWLEKLGTLAKYGLIDPEPLFALNSPDYQHLWAVLKKVVDLKREQSSNGLMPFDNAEYLCTSAWRWLRDTHGRETYEKLAQRYGWEQ